MPPRIRIPKYVCHRQVVTSAVASRRAPLDLADVPQLRGALVSNARGVAPVSAIDAHPLETDATRMRVVTDVYAALPWDPI